MNECFIGGTSGAGVAGAARPLLLKIQVGLYASPEYPWMHPGGPHLSTSLLLAVTLCSGVCMD